MPHRVRERIFFGNIKGVVVTFSSNVLSVVPHPSSPLHRLRRGGHGEGRRCSSRCGCWSPRGRDSGHADARAAATPLSRGRYSSGF
ncbi:unnamed protein product [Urochloa humidicola]